MDQFELQRFLEKQDDEIKAMLAKGEHGLEELKARMMQLEQRAVSRAAGGGNYGGGESLGALILKDAGFQAMGKGGRSSGQIQVGTFTGRKATTIITGTWAAPPDFRPQMIFPAQALPTVRDLLPVVQTSSNLIEFPAETALTDMSDYQGVEGSAKGQSDFTYTLKQAPIATLATWIACSKQVFEDSTSFSGYIDSRLIYLVQHKTEHELLYGDGGSGHLNGLMTQATALAVTPPDLIDGIAQAIAQLAAANVVADALVVHPTNYWNMRMAKASGSGDFLVGSPLSPFPPTLWGLQTALSTAIAPGSFLVGNFKGAAIFDRQAATVEVSREHQDFFVKNLVAILSEERLALAVYSPANFVKGSVGAGS
jgi:HK97 family phage major capsid protein